MISALTWAVDIRVAPCFCTAIYATIVAMYITGMVLVLSVNMGHGLNHRTSVRKVNNAGLQCCCADLPENECCVGLKSPSSRRQTPQLTNAGTCSNLGNGCCSALGAGHGAGAVAAFVAAGHDF